ncbi:MAG: class I SAM-dependent methyltransferase [Thermodesulforhabdaceae bacterium]
MKEKGESFTALRAALYRAAHQLFDEIIIFRDPISIRILYPDEKTFLKQDVRWSASQGLPAILRSFVAVRSRYAEDKLKDAIAKGVRQYVILGAGLDTFAYRNPWSFLKVFEVDHPETQVFKLQRLQDSSIQIPSNLTFVPMDFESQDLGEVLLNFEFDPSLPSFFSWLGVTMYLSEDSIMKVLQTVVSLPGVVGIVFDYISSKHASSPAYAFFKARLEQIGEPIRSNLDPEVFGKAMESIGWRVEEDLDSVKLNERYFGGGELIKGSGRIVYTVKA